MIVHTLKYWISILHCFFSCWCGKKCYIMFLLLRFVLIRWVSEVNEWCGFLVAYCRSVITFFGRIFCRVCHFFDLLRFSNFFKWFRLRILHVRIAKGQPVYFFAQNNKFANNNDKFRHLQWHDNGLLKLKIRFLVKKYFWLLRMLICCMSKNNKCCTGRN